MPLPASERSRWAAVVLVLFAACNPRAESGEWVLVASLPEARWFHAAGTTSSGDVFAFGGRVPETWNPKIAGSGTGADAFVHFDAAEDAWRKISDSPLPKRSVLVIDSRAKGSWPERVSFPSYRERTIKELHFNIGTGSPVVGDAVFWFNDAGGAIFRTDLSTWHLPPEAPFFVRSIRRYDGQIPAYRRSNFMTATGPGGKIYVLGGYTRRMGHRPAGKPQYGFDSEDKIRVSATMERFDPNDGTWMRLAPMRIARQLAAATFGPDGKLYVFGGYGGLGKWDPQPGEDPRGYEEALALSKESLRSVEAFDPTTGRWEHRAPLPQPRENTGACLGADGLIYVVGGASSFQSPQATSEVFAYDPIEDSWYHGPPLQTARYGHAIACSQGRVFAIGGLTTKFNGDSKRLAAVEMLDTRNITRDGLVPIAREPAADPRYRVKGAFQALSQSTTHDQRGAVRLIEKYATKADASEAPAIAFAMRFADEHARQSLVVALRYMENGAEEVLAEVELLLDDEASAIRLAAARTFIELGGDRAAIVEPMVRLLREQDRAVRILAIDILRSAGEIAVPSITSELSDPGHPIPEELIEALAALGASGMTSLTLALDHPDEHVRRLALYHLGRLGGASGAPNAAIVERLRDPDAAMRFLAAWALARAGAASKAVFLDALNSTDDSVRATAAWGLGEVGGGDPFVVEQLQSLVRSFAAQKGVPTAPEQAAREALERMGAACPACESPQP